MYDTKSVIDKSWNPIVNMLYQEPLEILNKKILPNISFQPKRENIFKVFSMSVTNIRVVILGQDPYPTPGNAIGYAFAKPPLRKNPASLRNIEKEIRDSGQINSSNEVDLLSWVDQGVFLLNTALTVETGKAGSHLKYWEEFTKRVIGFISNKQPCLWLLWGRKAQSFIPYIVGSHIYVMKYNDKNFKSIPIDSNSNYIISTPHPSPFSAHTGFLGSNCFKRVNEILKKKRLKEIIW